MTLDHIFNISYKDKYLVAMYHIQHWFKP